METLGSRVGFVLISKGFREPVGSHVFSVCLFFPSLR